MTPEEIAVRLRLIDSQLDGDEYKHLSDEDKDALAARMGWEVMRRAEQVPPEGEWDIWFLLGGRGSGKTRTGAEELSDMAMTYEKTRWACVAPTWDACRSVQFEGESGLLAVIPNVRLWGADVDRAYNSSKLELKLSNGSVIRGFTSEKPARLRGPQMHGFWADEPAEFRDAHKHALDIDTTFSNLLLAARLKTPALGERNPGIVTGTPKPCMLLAGEDGRPGLLNGFEGRTMAISKMRTSDNLGNLSAGYAKLVTALEGTRIGRQELNAELLTDVEGSLWRHEWIFVDRAGMALDKGWQAIVVGVDPAGSSRKDSDETGIVVCGIDTEGVYWVLEDLSGRYSPGEWADETWDAVQRWEAGAIVVERNFGADMVADTILRHTEAPASIVKEVHASRGKMIRAQPVAILYEPSAVSEVGDRVRHADVFPKLVDQMTSFTQTSGKSPDRLDAMVWALLWLSRFESAGGDGEAFLDLFGDRGSYW